MVKGAGVYNQFYHKYFGGEILTQKEGGPSKKKELNKEGWSLKTSTLYNDVLR